MTASSRIEHLIAVAAPYWAGEAEVVRTYFTSPKRTRETDLLWLRRQCFKEFWGSGTSKHDRGGVFLGVLKSLVAKTPDIDVTFDRHDVLDVVEGLKPSSRITAPSPTSMTSCGPPGRRSSTRTSWRAGPRRTRSRRCATATRTGTARSGCARAASPKAATAPCSAPA